MTSTAPDDRAPTWYDAAMWAIAFAALALRLLHLWQIHRAPVFDLLMGDALRYDQWAQRLAAGDWLGREVFYQAPLYPYTLGAIYRFLGRDVTIVRTLQAALGAVSCLWLGWAGRRFFGWRIGLTAAALLAIYPSAIFFDTLIQKTVLDTAGMSLLLLTMARADEQPRPRRWLAIGLVLGLLCTTRENALVLVPALMWWLWRSRWPNSTPRRRVGLMLAGVLLMIAPASIRNSALAGEFHLVAADGGTTLWTGNNPNADGTYQPLVPLRGDPRFERLDAKQLAEAAAQKPLRDAEVSRYWTGLALEWIRTHPGQWARLTWRKWLLVWNWLEIGDTEDQYTYGRWSPLLRGLTPLLHFGVVVPLAGLGLWCTWRRHRRAWVIPIMGLAYAASLALAFLFARYRMTLVPTLLLLAACALIELADALRARQLTPLIPGLGLAVVAVFVSNSDILPRSSRQSMQAATYSNIGARMLVTDRASDAIEMLRESTRLAPGHALPHHQLSRAFAATGETGSALREGLLAFSLTPSADIAGNLAEVFLKLGAAPEANAFYRMALRLDPHDATLLNNHALFLIGQGRLVEAVEELKQILRESPDRPQVAYNLAQALSSLGRQQEAMSYYERAASLAPNDAEIQQGWRATKGVPGGNSTVNAANAAR